MTRLRSSLGTTILATLLCGSVACDGTADTDPVSEPDTDTDTIGDPDSDTESSSTSVPLRLATWNMSRLDVAGEGSNPRTPEHLALFGEYADRLAADVVAIQEVRGVAGTQTVFPATGWTAECEDRDSSQNVCVVLRTDSGWSMARNADVTALNQADPNLRQGLDLTLTQPGHEPLRILALHLKFGCLSGETASDCGVYFDQIAVVEDWIDARTRAGDAYIVLGDWNRFMTATDSAWLEIDDNDPVGADLTRSIPQGTPTPCWSDVFSEFLDHIVLDPTSAGWMQGSNQLAYDETDFDTYSEILSDHCPVWADLQVPATR